MKPYQRHIADISEFPQELTSLPIWCAWKLVQKPGKAKPDKVPVSPHNGSSAGWTDIGFCSTAEQAITYAESDSRLHGVGIVLYPEYELVGGDLDRCIVDGEISDKARDIIETADTYTETSPGLSGLRFIAKGTFGGFTGNNQKEGVEFYEDSRFLTMTGMHLESSPFAVESRDLTVLGERYHSKQKDAPASADAPEPAASSAFDDLDIPGHCREWIINGIPKGKDRSNILFGIAKDLLRAGASDARVLAILSDPGHGISAPALERRGGDVESARSWLWQYCIAPAIRKVKEETPKKSSTFRLTRAGELLKTPAPLEWLVRGYLMPESSALLFGAPAAGKSLYCIDWAACIALGREWHGKRVKQGAVVYLAGEGHFGISRRLKAWAIENNAEDALLSAPLLISDRGAALNTNGDLFEVIEAIDAAESDIGKPALIVVDTLHRNMQGDENSAQDMGAYFNAVDELRSRYKCTVLTVHHSGHNEANRSRGSSAIRAALDIELCVEHKTDDSRVLSSTKMKDGPAPGNTTWELKEIVLPWHDIDGEAERSVVMVPSDKTHSTGKPMPQGIKHAMESYFDAADSIGCDASEIRIDVEVWREYFYQTHTGDNPDAKKKAFQRQRSELVKAGVMSVKDDVYTLNSGTFAFRDMSELVSARMLTLGGTGTRPFSDSTALEAAS